VDIDVADCVGGWALGLPLLSGHFGLASMGQLGWHMPHSLAQRNDPSTGSAP